MKSNDSAVLSAKKVAVKYRYYISIPSMIDVICRLDYNLDTMFIQNGWWEINDNGTIYADDIQIKEPPIRLAGIGFFECYDNKLPSIIMNTDSQKLYLLDDRHIDEFNQTKFVSKRKSKAIMVTLEFDNIFGNKSQTWNDVLEMADNYVEN